MREKTDEFYHKEDFPQPDDPKVPVWRYMSLAKLIWLLDNKKFFMPKLTLLKDPLEGSLTKMYSEILPVLVGSKWGPNAVSPIPVLIRRLRDFTYASCWRLAPNDSDAMWRLYCGPREGVAVKTAYQTLRDAVGLGRTYIGRVTYLDYDTDLFGVGNPAQPTRASARAFSLYYPVMHKCNGYDHEQEVRVVNTDHERVFENMGKPDDESSLTPAGVELEIEPDKLIHVIYVHPRADDWYFDAVKSAVGCQSSGLEVNWSPIKRVPYF